MYLRILPESGPFWRGFTPYLLKAEGVRADSNVSGLPSAKAMEVVHEFPATPVFPLDLCEPLGGPGSFRLPGGLRRRRWGCAESRTSTVPSVSLSFAGGLVSVRQAETASLPVMIQRGRRVHRSRAHLGDGLPQGVSLGVAPAGDITGDSATVSFIAAPTAGAGSVQAMLRVAAVGGSPGSGSPLTIQVQPPPAGFQVTLGASSLTLPRPLPGDTGPRLSRPIPVTLIRAGVTRDHPHGPWRACRPA